MRSTVKRLHRHLKNHLVPHAGNRHHPHLLRHRGLFGMSAMLISVKVLALILPITVLGAPAAKPVLPETFSPGVIIQQTNWERSRMKLATLETDHRLTAAAQQKADDMATRGYFSHTSPDGESAIELIRAHDYPVHYAAENLAVHYAHADEVQEGWMNSPTHRLNILDPRYKDIGIGIANGYFEGRETTFVVELFGSQISTKKQPEPVLVTAAMLPGTEYAHPEEASPLSAASLDQLSREFSLYVIALLTGLLMLMLAIRFRREHLASVTHTMAVVALAAILMLV